MSLAGKVALITGGSKGIGKATALRLAKDGASIALGYQSDASSANNIIQEIGTEKAIAIKVDAGNVASISSLVDLTVQRFGRIDILIAAAGTMVLSPLEETTEELFDKTFAVNVKGPFFLCQKAVPYMPPGSHIVLFSTTLTAASTVLPGYLPYVSSKGAIEQMTRVLCKDVGRKATDMFLRNQTEQSLNYVRSANPNGRLGDPEDIAFLCSNDSRWVSGQTLRVNGGMA